MTTRIRRTKADKSRDFGWWQALPRERTLVNKASGQRVRRVGPSKEAGAPAEEGWWRFEYEDEEGVRFPILARTALMSELGWPWPRVAKRQGLVVDYGRSVALWRQEVGTDEPCPPYGLWRRVDDCITDALPCWPRMTSGDRVLFGVYFLGGWLNGAWRMDFRRYFSALDRNSFKPGKTDFEIYDRHHRLRDKGRLYEAERPTLLPLDMPAPSPWRFHPFPSDPLKDGEEVPAVESDVRLANERWIDQGDCHGLTVPAEFPLTGFEGRTPYMQSIDKSRVLFVSSSDKTFDARSREYLRLQYADANITTHFPGDFSGRFWDLVLRGLRGEFRHPDFENKAEYFVREEPVYVAVEDGEEGPRFVKKGESFYAPSHAIWQRLSRELVDAWLFWKGMPAREVFFDPMVMPRAEQVSIKGNYLGGVWPAGQHFTAWLAKGAGTNRDFTWW